MEWDGFLSSATFTKINGKVTDGAVTTKSLSVDAILLTNTTSAQGIASLAQVLPAGKYSFQICLNAEVVHSGGTSIGVAFNLWLKNVTSNSDIPFTTLEYVADGYSGGTNFTNRASRVISGEFTLSTQSTITPQFALTSTTNASSATIYGLAGGGAVSSSTTSFVQYKLIN